MAWWTGSSPGRGCARNWRACSGSWKGCQVADENVIQALEDKIAELRRLVERDGVDLREELALLEQRLQALRREHYRGLSDWDRVRLARHPGRPRGLELVRRVCEDFYELRGDRMGGDDPALRGGLARLGERPVVVLFHHRGSSKEEQRACRAGMALPSGYRKAARLMRLADRLRLPLVTFIDTPGAYPGVEAEERNIAGAIAECIATMLSLSVPTVAVILGEGGSGGAIALAVADRVLMLENATYTVISPEGAAAILWKDATAAPQAAQALALSAPRLLELGVVDEVIPEPLGGAHVDPGATAQGLRASLIKHLAELQALPVDKRRHLRYSRYRNAGSRGTKAKAG
ncbi:acetyl-CoA carboxylase carboxyltransferase subunit alpha [Candidatus Bipolaricaulota bacterium]|nr:acetyl-CoA carboxylase carboxyltransferase subunit alpha [Candidatus Bipolaricaulota bacterium]